MTDDWPADLADLFDEDVFPDPDSVGQSEYRVLHELLEDCLVEDARNKEVTSGELVPRALGILAEVADWCRELSARLESWPAHVWATVRGYKVPPDTRLGVTTWLAGAAFDEIVDLARRPHDRVLLYAGVLVRLRKAGDETAIRVLQQQEQLPPEELRPLVLVVDRPGLLRWAEWCGPGELADALRPHCQPGEEDQT